MPQVPPLNISSTKISSASDSSMGAVFELARVNEEFLMAFKELEVDTRSACERVMKWAKGVRRTFV